MEKDDVKYFQATTDASDVYRANAAVGTSTQAGTVVPGTLSDLMRNATIFKATFVSPVVVHVNNPVPDTNAADTYGPI
jgi:hypothetical protein